MIKALVNRAHTPNAVARGRATCTLALLASLAAGTIGAAWLATRPEFGFLAASALFAGAIVLGVLLAQAFYDMEGLYEQRGRDLRAALIWDDLEAGRPPQPFTLYLRPFASTDAIGETDAHFVQVQATRPGPIQLAMGADRLEFEAQIEKALRPLGALVALGQPLEHEGAGRIPVTDGAWQDAIAALMEAAQLIILLPSSRPGTNWEVERILTGGYLPKTLVVDPPNTAGSKSRTYDHAREWADIRTSFAAHGYALPEDDEDGLIIHFGEGREPRRMIRAGLGSLGPMRRFARKTLRLMPAVQPAPPA